MAKILITGGSGMIGGRISKRLTDEGHQIVHLSRSPQDSDTFKSYHWDLKAGTIDETALDGVDTIIHLAGASIAQRWTDKNKKAIISSRVDTAHLVYQYVQQLGVKLKSFISISGIGYYGGDTGDTWLNEESPAGSDFVAEVARQWEEAADQFQGICKVTKIRAGIVLSNEGGALPKMALPVRFGVGAAIGSGKQYMSWIHIDDLAAIFNRAVNGELAGTYNAVASPPVTNREFTQVIAKTLHRLILLPGIPTFIMKAWFGEMSVLVTGGNRVSNEKLMKSSFGFKFATLDAAIKDLLT